MPQKEIDEKISSTETNQTQEGQGVQKKEVSVDDAATKALKNLITIENGDFSAVDGKLFASEYKNDDLKRVLMVFPENTSEIK